MCKISKELSEEEFDKYIKPFLKTARRGYVSKEKLYHIFKAILFVLKEGTTWSALKNYTTQGVMINPKTAYYHFSKWSKDGSFKKLYEKRCEIEGKEDVFILDSSYVKAINGGEGVEYSGYKKMNSTKTHFLVTPSNHILCDFNTTGGNNNDMNEFSSLDAVLQAYKNNIKQGKTILLADSGYDCKEIVDICKKHGMRAMVKKNKRNSKNETENKGFIPELYKLRSLIEKTFAWLKLFLGIRLRHDKKLIYWLSRIRIACTIINLRHELAA